MLEMKRKAPKTYSPEFKAEAVRLVIEEKRVPTQVARELGLTRSMFFRWVREAQTPRQVSLLSRSEQEELSQLRKENRILKMEREILKKATAFFAKEQR